MRHHTPLRAKRTWELASSARGPGCNAHDNDGEVVLGPTRKNAVIRTHQNPLTGGRPSQGRSQPGCNE